jgi:hypothetical protein
VIPEIDIWRAATLMLKHYGDKALEESAARADEMAALDDYHRQATWCQRRRENASAGRSKTALRKAVGGALRPVSGSANSAFQFDQ